jgi:hypothetical protein
MIVLACALGCSSGSSDGRFRCAPGGCRYRPRFKAPRPEVSATLARTAGRYRPPRSARNGSHLVAGLARDRDGGAASRDLPRLLALKVAHETRGLALARLAREAQIATRVQHP